MLEVVVELPLLARLVLVVLEAAEMVESQQLVRPQHQTQAAAEVLVLVLAQAMLAVQAALAL